MTTSELGQGCQFCYLRFIQAANTSTVISYLYIFPATGKVQSKILILKARLNNKDLEKQYAITMARSLENWETMLSKEGQKPEHKILVRVYVEMVKQCGGQLN